MNCNEQDFICMIFLERNKKSKYSPTGPIGILNRISRDKDKHIRTLTSVRSPTNLVDIQTYYFNTPQHFRNEINTCATK